MPDIKTTASDWVSVNTLTGISVGNKLNVQNKSTKFYILQEGATKPDIGNFEGEYITSQHLSEPSKATTVGSPELWVRNCSRGEGLIFLHVQDLGV